ncbi:solute carrier organic anion transporter family member 6A1 [Onychomys torridus]|uniref:solute carrier organic anion transporter family member 6A1 n=1 Tax=Onychomys torridus TaxID=38674 RepID=UPI00167F6DD9|nr:solute carrier organic anion transporter family member 6A1 [Onychomys torridus]
MDQELEHPEGSVEEVNEENDRDEYQPVGLSKLSPYLTTVPAAMIKFSSLRKTKMPDTSATTKLPDAKQSDLLEGPFGLGSLVFPSLQRFNNITFFLFMNCIVVLAQGLIFGFIDLSTGHFEKEFYLSRPEKIILSSAYDFASLLIAIPVAHYGSRWHRPKWVAAAAFLVGLGSIFCAVPYMKYEIVTPLEEGRELCIEPEHRTMMDCKETIVPHRSEILGLIILGQCLQGFAAIPIYVLGVTYIYDHSAKYSSGIYIGVTELVQVLGYGLGYIVGSTNLKPPNPEDMTEGYLKQQVIWWAGYLLATLLSWIAFFPLLCFPTYLPGAHKLRLRKERGPLTYDKELKYKKFGPSLKDLFHALQCLFRNPLMICYAMCKATESLTYIGVSEFLPKYLENQFLLTPSLATLLTGIILIPGGAIGNFLGGLIVSKLRMSCRSQMKFVIVTSITSLLLFILIAFVQCETVHFAGISEDYDGAGVLGNLTAPCNKHCECESSIFDSVCGRDDVEYFSPCFAGCTAEKHLQNERTFYNCSCIKEGLTTADTEGDFVDAVQGKCNTKCFKLPLFFAFFFSSIAFSTSSAIPITLIILQTVPPPLKSLGMGVTYTALRLFGSIPGPLLFRLSASNSCIYWDINKCGIRGRCWIYNKSKMAYTLLGLCSACKLVTIFLLLSAIRKYDAIDWRTCEDLNSKDNTLSFEDFIRFVLDYNSEEEI